MKKYKAMYYEFRSDCYEYGFLNALNRLAFDIGFLHTKDFTPARERVHRKYMKRKLFIEKLNKFFKGRS